MNWTHAKKGNFCGNAAINQGNYSGREGTGLKVQASENKENLRIRNYEVNPNYFCFMAMKTVNENVLSEVFTNATAQKKESL